MAPLFHKKQTIASLCLFAGLLFGSSRSDSIEVKYRFNPIIKTGTKVSGAQRDIAASITVVNASKISQASSHSLMSIAESAVPGLYLTEWNVMGFGVAGSAAGKLSMRGIGGTADTHIMILRNGRPDCMGLMGCTIADEFSSEGIERIEVIRGPASFLYGSNASAGVINIVTKSMKRDGYQTEIGAGYGAFNTHKYSIQHRGKSGNTDYQITASRKSTDGFRKDTDNPYESNGFSAHLRQRLSNKVTLEFNGNLSDIYLFDPGLTSSPKHDDWYDILRWGGDLTLNYNHKLGDFYTKVHGNFGKHKFADGWRSWDEMIGLMLYQNLNLFTGNTSTVGFDIKNYGGYGENKTLDWQGNPGVPYTEKDILEYAPYIHIQQFFFNRLIGSAGFRLENHSLYGTVPIPKFGLVYHMTGESTFRISHTKGFRSPSVRELYFFPTKNEDLQPDEFWNTELGFSHQFNQNLRLQFTAYHIEGDNIITLAPRSSGSGFQLSNSGRIENNGYEIECTWLPSHRLESGITWSYVDMKYVIANMPAKKLTWQTSGHFGPIDLSANLMWISDWISKDTAKPVANTYTMKDYTILDVSASIRIYGPLQIKTTVKNCLDTRYQAMYGYPMPGRYLLLDMMYHF